jgi:hypothetical protein
MRNLPWESPEDVKTILLFMSINEVECDVELLDACGYMFASP